MRLFIAVDLPAPVREDLRQLIESLRGGLRRLRWVRAEGIHLTLKFLGDTSQEGLEGLRRQLGGAVPGCTQPFDLRIVGVGLFPERGRPRVLWAGLEETPEPGRLQALQRRVDDAAEAAGFPREPRPFKPHLTLARFTEGVPSGLEESLAGHREKERRAFTVSSVCVFESLLKPGGAEYRKLEEYPL